MKKRLIEAKRLQPGDAIKITGYVWEVSDVVIDNDRKTVTVSLWLWARPAKTCTLSFNDPNFPVTVR